MRPLKHCWWRRWRRDTTMSLLSQMLPDSSGLLICRKTFFPEEKSGEFARDIYSSFVIDTALETLWKWSDFIISVPLLNSSTGMCIHIYKIHKREHRCITVLYLYCVSLLCQTGPNAERSRGESVWSVVPRCSEKSCFTVARSSASGLLLCWERHHG